MGNFNFDTWIWFVVLVPLAALAGWVIGRRGGEHHSDSQVSKLSTTYFRGLNYLLNELPDKAIELFLHIAELDMTPSRPRSRWGICSAGAAKWIARSACTRRWRSAAI